jgi:hypothetical protein
MCLVAVDCFLIGYGHGMDGFATVEQSLSLWELVLSFSAPYTIQ